MVKVQAGTGLHRSAVTCDNAGRRWAANRAAQGL